MIQEADLKILLIFSKLDDIKKRFFFNMLVFYAVAICFLK